jgi:hypothetical protein
MYWVGERTAPSNITGVGWVGLLHYLQGPPHPQYGRLGVLPIGGGYLTGAASDTAEGADRKRDRGRDVRMGGMGRRRHVTGEERLGTGHCQLISAARHDRCYLPVHELRRTPLS